MSDHSSAPVTIFNISTANTAASLGDRLFWATLKPFSLVVLILILYAVQIHTLKNIDTPHELVLSATIAIVASLLVYNIPALIIRNKGLKDSYDGTEDNFYGLININWNKIIYILKTLGQALTCGIFIYSIYVSFVGEGLSADVITKVALLVSFLVLSLWTKKLNIPNMYLYMLATLIFCVAAIVS